MAKPIDPTRVISGNYGYVYDENGTWLANVISFEASLDISKEDVPRAGTRKMGKKTTATDGSGTMNANKISSYFIQNVLKAAKDNATPYVTEFNVKLEDPENGGTERWRVKGVQFDNIPAISFEVGSLTQEEYNFTFESVELVQAIEN